MSKEAFCEHSCVDCPVFMSLRENLDELDTMRQTLTALTTAKLTSIDDVESHLSAAFSEFGGEDLAETLRPHLKGAISTVIKGLGNVANKAYAELDKWSKRPTQVLERVQRTCHGPKERKEYILLGPKILKCTSPWAYWYSSAVKPNKRYI